MCIRDRITAAILHDIGKTKELSLFPQNDYTDDGQLLGHIMIGAEMVHDAAPVSYTHLFSSSSAAAVFSRISPSALMSQIWEL